MCGCTGDAKATNLPRAGLQSLPERPALLTFQGFNLHQRYAPRRVGTWLHRPALCRDDGWLLTLTYDAPRDRTYMTILDARSPDADPRVRVWFEHAFPFTFHDTWMPSPPSRGARSFQDNGLHTNHIGSWN
ncbi:carotenoid oxygenase family protein [Archangium violaceum]|uniref:carotenoid oxygenase family protein n=1 Tax=Archangium violaceum TaxID=83451 RepID=UPI0035E3DB5D